MALTLPTAADLTAYREGISDAEALQRAADLFTIATGLTETPTDEVAARLVEVAVLDMAWYLQTNHEDREAEFSPFSSERIGSYSYSKMATAAAAKTSTGISGFDAAVAYFAGLDRAAMFATDTEFVFDKGYHKVHETVWDRPMVIQIEGGRIELDADGNPILEVEEG